MKYLAVSPTSFAFGESKTKAKNALKKGASVPLNDSEIGIYQVPDDYTVGTNRWGEGSSRAIHIAGPCYIVASEDT